MKIKIKNIPVYCLTCELVDGYKKNHIKQEFCNMNSGLGVEFINPILKLDNKPLPKNKSGASGFIRMIESGLLYQTPGKPFAPFILLEDDVSFLNGESINRIINIPDHTDILYIGLSCCSMNNESFHYNRYYDSVQYYPEIVRINHMLSSHGIMVCSPLGAASLQRTMMETWFSDRAWDIPMAYIQPYYNVYAVREPIVYQNAIYGGDESCTNIKIEGEVNRLPSEYIVSNLATIFVPDKKII